LFKRSRHHVDTNFNHEFRPLI
jgi:hypothetical protein